ncbi:NACHT domain-containing protein [Micromonospora sp. NPDC001898]|uniref:NACHT domain-containing protein n=1 Tax=Micromonospora sp. NPDC001898 TaxID=3364221 RepID=UPI00367D7E63
MKRAHRTLVAHLLRISVPVPWMGSGFDANLQAAILPFFDSLAARFLAFFNGLEAWSRIASELGVTHNDTWLRKRIVETAAQRYRNDYRLLAAKVPEFGMWVLLDQFESAETVRKVEHRQSAQFMQHSLVLLEELLSQVSRIGSALQHRSREMLAQRNQQFLSEPLAPVSDLDRLSGLRMPDVRSGYVNPRFRWAVVGADSRTWDEQWWQRQAPGRNLDQFLAGYFVSARATEQPLVILGHPGAGKSLLTKIVAARLPPDLFATVRVPLREVRNPAARIYEQVQEFLDEETHLGVRWRDLSDASKDATRVVLLDGLDELMQATGATESEFLHEVRQFQEKEAAIGSPVAVVVTSRTVVANIANIPAGSMVLKLEDFDQAQMADWVGMWNGVNQGSITSGTVKPLSVNAVWSMGELACQPLLLLMLAIFGATEELPNNDGGRVTQGQLYKWLLNGYVKREVTKLHGATVAPAAILETNDVSARVDQELWQLGLAAFAMFNRGRQSVTGEDLNRDLIPMLPATVTHVGPRKNPAHSLDAAIGTIARFFFIHAADTTKTLMAGSSYEFLHATFGEYLIAYHTLNQVGSLNDARRHVPLGQEWTDDQLFALLSHQQLSIGGAVLPFVRELFDAMPPPRQQVIVAELKTLVQTVQNRQGVGRLGGYNPSGRNLISRIAAYLGNLLALLTEISKEPIPLNELAPGGTDCRTWWRSTIRFLHSGLDETGWTTLLSILDVSIAGDLAVSKRRTPADRLLIYAYEARLAGDRDRELQILLGNTALYGRRLAFWDDPFGDACMKVLSSLMRRNEQPDDRSAILDMVNRDSSQEMTTFLVEYLVRCSGRLAYQDVRPIAQAVVATKSTELAVRLAPIVAQYPDLLREFPRLFYTYQHGLANTRDIAEVFAAVRVGLALWRGSEGEILKELLRHLVGKAKELGEPATDVFRQISMLDPKSLLPAIPSIVAVIADYYGPRGPVVTYRTSLISGQHRHD